MLHCTTPGQSELQALHYKQEENNTTKFGKNLVH